MFRANSCFAGGEQQKHDLYLNLYLTGRAGNLVSQQGHKIQAVTHIKTSGVGWTQLEGKPELKPGGVGTWQHPLLWLEMAPVSWTPAGQRMCLIDAVSHSTWFHRTSRGTGWKSSQGSILHCVSLLHGLFSSVTRQSQALLLRMMPGHCHSPAWPCSSSTIPIGQRDLEAQVWIICVSCWAYSSLSPFSTFSCIDNKAGLLRLGETGRNHSLQGCTAGLVVLLHRDKLSKTSLCPGWDISVRYPRQGCHSEYCWIYFRPWRFRPKEYLGACQRSRKGNCLGRLKVTHAWEPLVSPQWHCCLRGRRAARGGGSPGISSEHVGNASSVCGPAVPGPGGQGRALRGQLRRRMLLRHSVGQAVLPPCHQMQAICFAFGLVVWKTKALCFSVYIICLLSSSVN